MKDFKDFISGLINVDTIIKPIVETGVRKFKTKPCPKPAKVAEKEILRIDGGAGKSIDFCVIERYDTNTNQFTHIMTLNDGDTLIRTIGPIPTVEDAKLWVKANNRIVKNPEYHNNPSDKMIEATKRQYIKMKQQSEKVYKPAFEQPPNLNETVMQIAFRKALLNKK
jgi:hypothetical protein